MGRRFKEFDEKLHDKVMEEAIARICPVCHSGLLETHHDPLRAHEGWRKCPICGFSKKKATDDPKPKLP